MAARRQVLQKQRVGQTQAVHTRHTLNACGFVIVRNEKWPKEKPV